MWSPTLWRKEKQKILLVFWVYVNRAPRFTSQKRVPAGPCRIHGTWGPPCPRLCSPPRPPGRLLLRNCRLPSPLAPQPPPSTTTVLSPLAPVDSSRGRPGAKIRLSPWTPPTGAGPAPARGSPRARARASRSTVVVYYPVDGERVSLARRRKRARAGKEGAHFMLDAPEKCTHSSEGGCHIFVFGPARDFGKIRCGLQQRQRRNF